MPRCFHFKTNWDLLRKFNFWPSSWESNLRPHESNTILLPTAVANSMATSSVFMRWECRLRVYSEPVWHFHFQCHTVSEYTLNWHSHLINTELVAMLLATTSAAQSVNSKKTGAIPANCILKPYWRLTCGSICRSSQSPTR